LLFSFLSFLYYRLFLLHHLSFLLSALLYLTRAKTKRLNQSFFLVVALLCLSSGVLFA